MQDQLHAMRTLLGCQHNKGLCCQDDRTLAASPTRVQRRNRKDAFTTRSGVAKEEPGNYWRSRSVSPRHPKTTTLLRVVESRVDIHSSWEGVLTTVRKRYRTENKRVAGFVVCWWFNSDMGTTWKVELGWKKMRLHRTQMDHSHGLISPLQPLRLFATHKVVNAYWHFRQENRRAVSFIQKAVP